MIRVMGYMKEKLDKELARFVRAYTYNQIVVSVPLSIMRCYPVSYQKKLNLMKYTRHRCAIHPVNIWE
jgi:hypothetical protein